METKNCHQDSGVKISQTGQIGQICDQTCQTCQLGQIPDKTC